MFSAFLTQIHLGGFNAAGVFMTMIWSLSPLGAQSILRCFDTALKDTQTQGPVVYFDTNTPPFFTESTYWGQGGNIDLTRSMYTAAMLSADETKASSQDSWGNVKIPYMSSYENDHLDGSWVTVPDTDELVFSSLVGIPTAMTEPGSRINYTFNMESSYIDLKCSSVFYSNDSHADYVNGSYYGSYISFDNTSLITRPSSSDFPGVANGTWQACEYDKYKEIEPWVLAADTFIDPLWLKRKSMWIWSHVPAHMAEAREDISTYYSPSAFVNETNILTSQASLLLKSPSPLQLKSYGADRGADYGVDELSTTCSISQTYVESRIKCSRTESLRAGECSVIAQRVSQMPHSSTNITHLSFPWVFSTLSMMMPKASGLQNNHGLADTSLAYLFNTSSYFLLDGTSQILPSLDYITPRDIGFRLGQLINTYLMAGQAFESITGGISPGHIGNLSTLASIHIYEEVYIVSTAWVTVFFVTALVMFAGSVAGALFCHISKAPEILGYASSAIRDSKYVNLAPGFGALGGLEMTKAFEGIEFRYGVVGKLENGHQVLGISWQVNAQPVKRGVPYV